MPGPRTTRGENEDWRHRDLTPRLDRIDLPTLVLGGASDELTPSISRR